MRISFISLVLFLFMPFCPVAATDLYVSPGGSVQADGTMDRPFTLQEARRVARSFAGKEEVRIWLMDGIYYLEEALTFAHADGGTREHPVFYRAQHEGMAILSGGKRLDLEWEAYRNGIYVSSLSRDLDIDQLFINDQRQEMARFPNSRDGRNVFDHWNLNHSAAPDPENDPLSPERIARWKDPSGAYLHAMHRALWGGMHYRVKGKTGGGELELEGGWQNNRPDQMHQTYRFIEHVFEELDAPGEWYFDRSGGLLYYYPHPGQEMDRAVVEVVSLRHLVEFNGTPEKPVSHIHLEGLLFKHAARTFMDNREPLLRSDWTTYRGGAIYFDGAEHCSLNRCELDQLGGNSIFVNNYNRYINILSCHIQESGANGIAFVGDPAMVRDPLFRYGPQDYGSLDLTPGPKGHNYPMSCLVYDCIIEGTGRTEKQTAAVQVSMSGHITVSHCSIYDVPRAGINISEGTFGGHVIEYCDVFNTVLETGDHGSFNSWGRDRFWDPDIPTMNREVGKNPRLPYLDMTEPNIIRNSRWRCDHGWDIDLDDGSSQYRIFNNLLLNGGLKLREGYDRRVWNNIVVNNGLHPHVWPRNSGDVISRNIFFTSHRAIAMNRGMAENEKWGCEIDYNIFTSNHMDRLLYAGNGCDAHSIVADPRFLDPGSGDFSIDAAGEAYQLGFRNFEMHSFGVLSPHLRALVKTPEIPMVHMEADTSGAGLPDVNVSLWEDAQLTEPSGQALSAYGVSLDSRGVAMAYVPEFSGAWGLGFRTGDLVMEVDGNQINGLVHFIKLMDKMGKHELVVVRNQQRKEFTVPAAGARNGNNNKVLVIGIDGCRPDALLAAGTPNMDKLWKEGAYTFRARTDEISSSGPAWSAMLTGVWHQKHKVLNNDYEDPDLEHFPHFFHRIRQEEPELRTYAVANWGPIHKILQEGDASYVGTKISDAQVAQEVASLLEKEDVDVMFVQLDEVDGAGHRHDYSVESKKYLQAIERSDKQVGRMISALERRSSIGQENWLIILSADHGGSDFGHGKNIPEHTTVFYIASGKSAIKGEIRQDVGVVDVAVTALYHLGIPAKAEWDLDGRVAGL